MIQQTLPLHSLLMDEHVHLDIQKYQYMNIIE